MNHAHNSVKNKITKPKTRKSTSQLGRPGQIRRPTTRANAAQHSVRPRLATSSAATTDKGDPRVSERNRGGRTAGGVVRRRWLLRRRQRCQHVCLTQAHLGEPIIAASDSARGGGDGHGGARPRHGRLRRGYGVMALVAHSTSFSVTHRG